MAGETPVRFTELTSPVTAASFRMPDRQGYRFPPGKNGEILPGVTSVLKRTFPAPALVKWQKRVLLDYIQKGNGYPHLINAGLSKTEWHKNREALLERGVDRSAGEFGLLVHEWFEALWKGERFTPPADEFAWVDGEHRRRAKEVAEAALRFLSEAGLEPQAVEMPVFRPSTAEQPGWAGTADVFTSSPEGAVLVDLKSGRAMRPHFPLQVAAYASAEFYVTRNGYRKKMPPVGAAFILHAHKGGQLALYRVNLSVSRQAWKQALLWDTTRRRLEQKLLFARAGHLRPQERPQAADPAPSVPR